MGLPSTESTLPETLAFPSTALLFDGSLQGPDAVTDRPAFQLPRTSGSKPGPRTIYGLLFEHFMYLMVKRRGRPILAAGTPLKQKSAEG